MTIGMYVAGVQAALAKWAAVASPPELRTGRKLITDATTAASQVNRLVGVSDLGSAPEVI
jgi:hypothetical protein